MFTCSTCRAPIAPGDPGARAVLRRWLLCARCTAGARVAARVGLAAFAGGALHAARTRYPLLAEGLDMATRVAHSIREARDGDLELEPPTAQRVSAWVVDR